MLRKIRKFPSLTSTWTDCQTSRSNPLNWPIVNSQLACHCYAVFTFATRTSLKLSSSNSAGTLGKLQDYSSFRHAFCSPNESRRCFTLATFSSIISGEGSRGSSPTQGPWHSSASSTCESLTDPTHCIPRPSGRIKELSIRLRYAMKWPIFCGRPSRPMAMRSSKGWQGTIRTWHSYLGQTSCRREKSKFTPKRESKEKSRVIPTWCSVPSTATSWPRIAPSHYRSPTPSKRLTSL